MKANKNILNAPQKRVKKRSRRSPRHAHCTDVSAPVGLTEAKNEKLLEKHRDVELGISGSICSLAVSPDGKLIAAGSDDGHVNVHDVATGYHFATLPRSSKACWWLKWSPDGERLAVCSERGPLWVWEVATRAVEGFEGLGDIAWSPDSSELCVLVDASGRCTTWYKIYNVASGEAARSYKNTLPYYGGGKVFGVFGVHVSWQANGLLKAVSIFESTRFSLDIEEATMIIEQESVDGETTMEAETSEREVLKVGVNKSYTPFGFNPDRTFQVVYDTYCEQLALLNTATGRKKFLPGHECRAPDRVSWSPNGQVLATSFKDRLSESTITVRVWNVPQGRRMVSFDLEGSRCPLEWSPCSKLLFAGGKGKIHICNMDAF